MKRILALCSVIFMLALADCFAGTPKLPASPKLPSGERIDVRDFGAVGDGVTDDTEALQKAIDACRGGTVVIPEGVFFSRLLTLHSNMELHLEEGAVLKADSTLTSFPNIRSTKKNRNWGEWDAHAFIYAYKARNLLITGPGTIDGSGYSSEWEGKREMGRPIPILLVRCRRVLLDNFLLKDGAMWNVIPFETDDFTMRRVSIDANIEPNRDGVDLVDTHRALVEDCTFYTDDDCICPKSGHKRGVRDVTVRNCRVLKCGRANAIKFGTMSRGAFCNMLFENISIKDVRLSGIAVESVDGARIRNVVFRNITMEDCGNAIFIVRGCRGTKVAGKVDGLIFEGIKSKDPRSSFGCVVAGTGQDMIRNVLFKDLEITFKGGRESVPETPPEYDGRYPECNMWGDSPAAGFYFRHVRGVRLENCKLNVASPDARELVVREDAEVEIL